MAFIKLTAIIGIALLISQAHGLVDKDGDGGSGGGGGGENEMQDCPVDQQFTGDGSCACGRKRRFLLVDEGGKKSSFKVCKTDETCKRVDSGFTCEAPQSKDETTTTNSNDDDDDDDDGQTTTTNSIPDCPDNEQFLSGDKCNVAQQGIPLMINLGKFALSNKGQTCKRAGGSFT